MREWSTLRKMMFLKGATGLPLVEYTATGNPLSFTTNVTKPLKSLLIPWTPTQTGSGDPSPSNVRSIVGVDMVNVWQTGKNLFDMTFPSKTSGGITYTNNGDGSLTINGTCTGFNPQQITFDIEIPAGKYYFRVHNEKANTGTGNSFFGLRDANGQDYGTNLKTVGAESVVTVTAPITKAFINIFDGAVFDNVTIRPTLAIGSYIDYVPYTGTTYSVQFPALGKNLCGNEIEHGAINGSTGREDSSTNRVRTKGYIRLEGGQYTISAVGVGQAFIYVYDTSEGYLKSESSVGFTNLPRTFKLDGERLVRIAFRVSSSNEDISPSDVSNVMLNTGTSALPYEPYTNTVYGGSLDLTTGVLTIDRKAVSLDGNAGWAVSGTSKFYVHLDDPLFYIARAYDSVQQYSNMWQWQKTQSGGSSEVTVNKRFYLQRSDPSFGSEEWNRVWVYDTDYTLTTFKALLNETPLQVTYSIVPYTVQLTPTQITALLNDNTIWSDTNGSNTAVYMKKG